MNLKVLARLTVCKQNNLTSVSMYIEKDIKGHNTSSNLLDATGQGIMIDVFEEYF